VATLQNYATQQRQYCSSDQASKFIYDSHTAASKYSTGKRQFNSVAHAVSRAKNKTTMTSKIT